MDEFNEVGKVEMDFHWTPRPLDEVLYKKSPSDYPKPKSMIEKEQPKPVQAKSPDPLPTPDEPDNSGDDDGDKELKELIAMMNKALKEKTA